MELYIFDIGQGYVYGIQEFYSRFPVMSLGLQLEKNVKRRLNKCYSQMEKAVIYGNNSVYLPED